MSRRYHVAIIGLRSENSSFSPLRTTLGDFRPVRDPDALRMHYTEQLSAQPGQRLDLAATQVRQQTPAASELQRVKFDSAALAAAARAQF
eukprot:COSAG05_NODE_3806_length_1829_cov_17.498844_2_plen_90_part_00